uniref:Uncharacterized protein n=1 Tax=Schistocephalus solidus TaxID=70667 RepID=A0A0V0J3R9_SCHSO
MSVQCSLMYSYLTCRIASSQTLSVLHLSDLENLLCARHFRRGWDSKICHPSFQLDYRIHFKEPKFFFYCCTMSAIVPMRVLHRSGEGPLGERRSHRTRIPT